MVLNDESATRPAALGAGLKHSVHLNDQWLQLFWSDSWQAKHWQQFQHITLDHI